MKRTCVQCGKEFDLSDGEIKFYRDKNLSLPKRCKECRAANKGNGNKTEPVEKPEEQKKSGKSGRYKFAGIAAAVALLAAGGGAYSYNSSNQDNIQQPPAYEYSVEEEADVSTYEDAAAPVYRFRNNDYLMEHYEKHGRSMGFASAEEYQAAASDVVNDERALHKLEAEDGDDVYYVEETNDFVIVSSQGYIRTYFRPSAGRSYYDRQ